MKHSKMEPFSDGIMMALSNGEITPKDIRVSKAFRYMRQGMSREKAMQKAGTNVDEIIEVMFS